VGRRHFQNWHLGKNRASSYNYSLATGVAALLLSPPLPGECTEDGQRVFMLGGNVRIQEGQDVREKGLEGQRVWVGGLGGQVPL
jgi:hypothetical protein